jgi:lysophospholipase L1-like esterase
MSNKFATAVVVLLVLVVAAMSFLVDRKMNSASVQNQAIAPPPTVETAGSSAPDNSNDPIALFIGDFTNGSDEGGEGAKNFTSLLVGTAQTATPLRSQAVGEGSGYVVAQASPTFVDQVRRFVGPKDRVVVISGSRNDIVANPVDVRAAAAETYELVQSLAPDATLLVVGPTFGKFEPTPEMLATRDAVKDAASAAGAAFADPLELRWFNTGEPGLIGADNVHLTDLGHQRMSEYLTPAFAQALQSTKGG